MSAPGPGGGFLARAAIGLWLCGVGALGFLQFYLRAVRGAAEPDLIAWLWLGGAIVVTAIGLAVVIRTALPRNGLRNGVREGRKDARKGAKK
ncbi:MAG: hypothetical protein H0W24_00595 [Lysobacter sp.]|nr:hypothetical protein [Lysobacter sp.]MDQ3270224.1 hypothetical protein [Pseudomonadota bacterium]